MNTKKYLFLVLCMLLALFVLIGVSRHFLLLNKYSKIYEELESNVNVVKVTWIDKEINVKSIPEFLEMLKNMIENRNSDRNYKKGVFHYKIIDVVLELENDQLIHYKIRIDNDKYDIFIEVRYKKVLIDSIAVENEKKLVKELNEYLFY